MKFKKLQIEIYSECLVIGILQLDFPHATFGHN